MICSKSRSSLFAWYFDSRVRIECHELESQQGFFSSLLMDCHSHAHQTQLSWFCWALHFFRRLWCKQYKQHCILPDSNFFEIAHCPERRRLKFTVRVIGVACRAVIICFKAFDMCKTSAVTYSSVRMSIPGSPRTSRG
jgi:hypothetical protein